jgi:hemoglobin
MSKGESEDLAGKSPFELIGTEAVNQIVRRFYAVMAEDEPALAKLHSCDEQGRVLPQMQEKFALFLVGWLGGPQDYIEQHGHPRLRMRHNHVRIDKEMRDAWLRSMATALDEANLQRPLREFLDERLYGMANHLINAE